MSRTYWRIVDSRTDRAVGSASYRSEEQARNQIDYYRERDAKGGRPGIHDLIPFLDTRPAKEGDW